METINNLAKAYLGECQARNRYTLYAKIAKKEGYEKIAEVFLETAENEREHSKWLLRLINQLGGKDIKAETNVPITLKDTEANLQSAIEGEHYENSSMYPEFAEIAEKEGLDDIAKRLRAIGKAEEHHEERYQKILNELKNNSLFKKEKKVYWVCRKCGYIHEGEEPPEKCPSCDHPKNYFELKCESY